MKIMAEYIEREKLIECIKDIPTWWADEGGVYPGSHEYPDGMYDPEDIINSIENAQSIDVAEVVHGKWVKHNDPETTLLWAFCTECGGIHEVIDTKFSDLTDDRLMEMFVKEFRYCPYCGARMDGVI